MIVLESACRSGFWASVLNFSRRRWRLRLDDFGLNQASVLAVVVENFGVASPVHGGLELALHFVFGKVFVENVVEKFVGDRMIRFALQDAVDLLEDGHVF